MRIFFCLLFIFINVLSIQGFFSITRRCKPITGLARPLSVRCSRDRRIGSVCRLRCPNGYDLRSQHTSLTCRSFFGTKTRWNEFNFLRKARCNKRQCPALPSIRPAVVFSHDCGNKNLFGQRCKLTCPRVGQILSGGSSTITCQANKQWSSNLKAYSCAFDKRCPGAPPRNCRFCPRRRCTECPKACPSGRICCSNRCGTSCVRALRPTRPSSPPPTPRQQVCLKFLRRSRYGPVFTCSNGVNVGSICNVTCPRKLSSMTLIPHEKTSIECVSGRYGRGTWDTNPAKVQCVPANLTLCERTPCRFSCKNRCCARFPHAVCVEDLCNSTICNYGFYVDGRKVNCTIPKRTVHPRPGQQPIRRSCSNQIFMQRNGPNYNCTDGNNFNSICTVTCPSGSGLRQVESIPQPQSIQCLKGGWSPHPGKINCVPSSLFRCRRRSCETACTDRCCPHHPTAVCAENLCGPFCNFAFYENGKPVNCNSNGKPPFLPTGFPTQPSRGCSNPFVFHVNPPTATCQDGYQPLSQCTFTCEPGYRLVGDSTATCGENLRWSVLNFERVQCIPTTTCTKPVSCSNACRGKICRFSRRGICVADPCSNPPCKTDFWANGRKAHCGGQG